MPFEAPRTIASMVKDISENKYVLPSIQREFVWSSSQIERLFDSIMQDYPIGAFLFWELDRETSIKYDFYSFLSSYHEKNCRHNPRINLAGNDAPVAVLDGQQRLTALYIGLKGTYARKLPYKSWKNDDAFPKRKLYINLLEPSREINGNYYDISFLTDSEAQSDEHHYWFLVGNILTMDISHVTSFLMEEIMPQGFAPEQCKFASRTLSQLFDVVHNKGTISYYQEKSKELDKVLNIFIRVNSGGTFLSYSDLLLSIASAQWESRDARQEITDFVESVNQIGSGFNINKDFVLKAALVLSDFRDIAFKVDNFDKSNMLTIEDNWPKITKAIYDSYILLDSMGFSRDSLSSNNAVIPIAYYLMTIGLPKNFASSSSTRENRRKIKKWLIMSLVKKVFSGQPDNVLRPLRDIIHKNGQNEFPLDEIKERFRGTNRSIVFSDDEIENILEYSYGKGNTLGVLMLLYPSLDFKNKVHVDHIYPKGKFTRSNLCKEGISEDRLREYIDSVNTLGNLQLLYDVPNLEKRDKDFATWFAETYSSENDKIQYRNIHYIPDMNYSYENFGEFLEKRKLLLKNRLVSLLM